MEEVYVVKREILFGSDTPQGFISVNDAIFDPNIIKKLDHGTFISRDSAEKNAAYKQVIPYSLLSYQGKLFIMRRTNKQDEQRLHGKLSIGVGGHINPIDAGRQEEACGSFTETYSPFGKIYETAAFREIFEEVIVPHPMHKLELLGYINDDSDEVGSVHFVVIFMYRLNDDRLGIREQDKITGSMRPWTDLWKQWLSYGPEESREKIENWSNLIISRLPEIMED